MHFVYSTRGVGDDGALCACAAGEIFADRKHNGVAWFRDLSVFGEIPTVDKNAVSAVVKKPKALSPIPLNDASGSRGGGV
jgi:hypothetical protein